MYDLAHHGLDGSQSRQHPALSGVHPSARSHEAAQPPAGPDAETAWRTYARMRTPALAGQPLAPLCAALCHAAERGVAGNARTMTESMQPDRLVAARLFTHLLWRLGQPLSWTEVHAVRRLLSVLPKEWSDSLAQSLRRSVLASAGAGGCSLVKST